MLLDAKSGNSASVLHNIPVASNFKYLGINVTPRPLDYIFLNLSPLITGIRDKVKLWTKLRLSVVGRTNLIKIIFMPQLLYTLHNSPMVISLKMFKVINSHLSCTCMAH